MPGDTERLLRRQTVVSHYVPDDEIIGNGSFHMERMNDGHIWFTFGDKAFDLVATKGPHGLTIRWTEQ